MPRKNGRLVLQLTGYPYAALPRGERDRFLSLWQAALNALDTRVRLSAYSIWDALEGFQFRRILFFLEGGQWPEEYRPRPAVEPPRPSPAGVERRRAKSILRLEDGSYARAYTVTRLPLALPEAWLLEVFDVIDELHMFVEPVEPAKARRMVDLRLRRVAGTAASQRTTQLDEELARLQGVKSAMDAGARLLRLAIVLIIRSQSIDGVLEKARLLENRLAARGAEASTGPGFYQKRLYMLDPEVPVYHFIDTLSAKALYPLVQEKLVDWGGFYLGYDIDTYEPVVFNPYERSGYNVVVLGDTGSGKSMTLKLYIRRYWAAGLGNMVAVIDPEGEYIGIREYLATGLHGYVLRESEEGEGLGLDPVRLWRQRYLGREEMVDLLMRFYGIPERLRGELVVSIAGCGSMDELLRRVEEKSPQLWDYLKAAQADMWIYRGEPPLPGGRGAVYALHEIASERAKALIGSLLAAVVAKHLARKGSRTLLVVDEGWRFAEWPGLMRLFNAVARLGRKRGINFVFASQRPEDLIDDPAGRTIISQADTKLLLSLSEESLTALTSVKGYNLDEDEQHFLLSAKPGQGILRVEGGWRLRIYIQPTQEELKIFSTRPGEW